MYAPLLWDGGFLGGATTERHDYDRFEASSSHRKQLKLVIGNYVQSIDQRPRGLSATESRALTFIYAGADTGALRSPKDLAEHLHLSAASVTVLVDRLADAGLVTRVRHPTDRRRISIIPTKHRIDPTTLTGVAGRMNTLAQTYTGRDADTIAAFSNQLTELITNDEDANHAVQSAS